ncbi:MAG: hypothetical protein K0Q76_4009, partial [Panacagrimonas sp.]
ALNGSGATVQGVELSFSVNNGAQISGGTITTDGSGRATAVLTTAGNPVPRGVTVTVDDDNGPATATTVVTVVAPANNADPNPQLGTLDGLTFDQGTFEFQLPSVSAGGSVGFRVDIVDIANGNTVITDPVNFTFSSPCITAGTAVVNPTATPPNTGVGTDGAVLATYQAKGCSGNDTVTARAVIGGQVRTAQGTINVLPSSLASIQFVSAVPINIGLRGSGLQETSNVTFRVVNAAGGPIPSLPVTFSLNTNLGGITLNPTSGTTGSDGTVSTVVTSGTVSTVVRVTATATADGTTVSSQSEQLTITTGIPDQDSFDLSAECSNVEGLNISNVQVPMLLLASDRFNNPVPEDTAVTFTTEGGSIVGSCVMQDGACTVNWRSQNPRPAGYNSCFRTNATTIGADFEDDDVCSVASPSGGSARPGRATVLAFAVGEESFDDTNGDGLFGGVGVEDFGDLSEAFRDDDEDGERDASAPTEPFRDFDSDLAFDDADGQYNGLLCATGDPTDIRCAEPRTLHVRDSLTIVMSGSSPVVSPLKLENGGDIFVTCPSPGGGTGCYDEATQTITIGENQTFGFSMVVRDVNNQPMPATTTIAFSQDGDAGAIQGTDSFDVPCTINDTKQGNTYGISYKGADLDAVDGSSTLEVSVTSPSGVLTIYRFNVVTDGTP